MGVQAGLASGDQTTLFPRSHKFQAHFSLSGDKDHGLRWGLPATGTLRARSHGGSPSGYLTDGFSHRQVIHSLPYLRKLSKTELD